jgi:hypothetical protein
MYGLITRNNSQDTVPGQSLHEVSLESTPLEFYELYICESYYLSTRLFVLNRVMPGRTAPVSPCEKPSPEQALGALFCCYLCTAMGYGTRQALCQPMSNKTINLFRFLNITISCHLLQSKVCSLDMIRLGTFQPATITAFDPTFSRTVVAMDSSISLPILS